MYAVMPTRTTTAVVATSVFLFATSQPQQTLQHINPSHQDEPFQSRTTTTTPSREHQLDKHS